MTIREALRGTANQPAIVQGWLTGRRQHGGVAFLDLVDSTAAIQVVAEIAGNRQLRDQVLGLNLESCIEVDGVIALGRDRNTNELIAKNVRCLSSSTKCVNIPPRTGFRKLDIFSDEYADQVIANYHLYLRNPRLIAVMRFRSELMRIVRDWFYEHDFVEFNAPILTPVTLYDEDTALGIDVHGESAFLTQCAGFYLEAAAQGLDRVFNMGPSFRGETSRSKRHMIEYWHIKAELLYGSREDIINLVETLIAHLVEQCQLQCSDIIGSVGRGFCLDGLGVPFPRIKYADAIDYLNGKGQVANFGEGINGEAEKILEGLLGGPFWIVGIPRTVEPFPYVIDPDDNRVTMVADLITSNGCGELLGVAEKISDPDMLRERMAEKGKLSAPSYQFIREVHDAGCAPHIAFGMGLERLIRWLLNLPHVKYAAPFPRLVRRSIYP